MTHSIEVTVAICCYNAANFLPNLLAQLVKQNCPLPWEILLINNNSTDNSVEIISHFSKSSSIPIRYILESEQGIAFARNRAIKESQASTFLAFIDADELPGKAWLSTAIDSLQNHSSDCVGGKIDIDLLTRPKWLCDSLLPFLGLLDHGSTPMKIINDKTPIWSGNIAYRLSLFKGGEPFDTRYNRKGKGIGGGEDSILFRKLLASNCYMRYEPKMQIVHHIPPEKLRRYYFVMLHFISGKKVGLFEFKLDSKNCIFGVPPYMFLLFFKKTLLALRLLITGHGYYMREAMNASHFLGQIIGLIQQNSSLK